MYYFEKTQIKHSVLTLWWVVRFKKCLVAQSSEHLKILLLKLSQVTVNETYFFAYYFLGGEFWHLTQQGCWTLLSDFKYNWENTVIFYDGYWWISCRHSEELRGNISRRAKHGGRYWPSIPMNEAWYSPISIIKNDSIHIVTQ